MSATAFNNMLGSFFDDLLSEFPDNKVIKEASEKPRTRLMMDRFMKYTGPRVHFLSSRNSAFFSEKNEIGVCDIWKTELSQPTRDAIWGHIQNLHMIGTSIAMLPPQMLAMVESTAEKFAKEAISDGGEMSEAKLMSSIQKMMGDLMKNMGGPSSPALD
jgi:hypothetical protein